VHIFEKPHPKSLSKLGHVMWEKILNKEKKKRSRATKATSDPLPSRYPTRRFSDLEGPSPVYTVHRQDVAVKNADGKKRRRTKRQIGQNVDRQNVKW
jgi:hypothetical protein